jgi:hypothetical protein
MDSAAPGLADIRGQVRALSSAVTLPSTAAATPVRRARPAPPAPAARVKVGRALAAAPRRRARPSGSSTSTATAITQEPGSPTLGGLAGRAARPGGPGRPGRHSRPSRPRPLPFRQAMPPQPVISHAAAQAGNHPPRSTGHAPGHPATPGSVSRSITFPAGLPDPSSDRVSRAGRPALAWAGREDPARQCCAGRAR